MPESIPTDIFGDAPIGDTGSTLTGKQKGKNHANISSHNEVPAGTDAASQTTVKPRMAAAPRILKHFKSQRSAGIH